jgi:hypothetical protein
MKKNKYVKICLAYYFYCSIPGFAIEGGWAFPKIYNLSFQNDKVGIILDLDKTAKQNLADDRTLRYASYDYEKINIIEKDIFKKQFFETKKIVKFESHYPESIQLKDSSGKVYNLKYIECSKPEEGSDECKKLSIEIDKKTIMLNMKKNDLEDRLIALERWGDYLWLGFLSYGESSEYGRGVAIMDVKTGVIVKKVYESRSINVSPDNASAIATVIKKDPNKAIMWIGGSYGLYGYDAHFNLIKSCNLLGTYVSNEKPLGVFKDRFDFTCDK